MILGACNCVLSPSENQMETIAFVNLVVVCHEFLIADLFSYNRLI